MFRSLKVRIALCITLLCSSAAPLFSAANIFDSVPADSLFVVRVHNLEYTLGSVDQFLTGLSPMPVAVSMMGRMQIANALGDANMANIDFRSDFAIFGIAGTSANCAANPPVIVAELLPVTDYSKMLAANPSASKPDANGISTIGPKKFFITQTGNYALFAPGQSYADIMLIAKSIKSGAMSSKIKSRLPDDTSSIWAWGDVKHAMQVYGDKFRAGLDNAQKTATDANNPQCKTIAPLIEAYFNIIKSLAAQTNDISIAADFKADLISLHKIVTPVPDSNFAKMLAVSQPSKQTGHKLLAYMPADSLMTVACNVDKPFTINLYEAMFDAFAPAFGPAFTSQTRQEAMDLTRKSINALGNSLAFSISPATKATPPFDYTYTLEIKDEKEFRDIVKNGIEMVKVPAWQQFFKNFGVTLKYTYIPSAETYNGVQIDHMILNQTVTDPNVPQSRAMMEFYGSQFLQKFAATNGLALLAGGADVNEITKKLIDQAKGGSAAIPEGLASSIALIPDANSHQFVGTYNYLRLMKMVALMSPQLHLPIDAVKQVKSTSNIAFAGDISKTQIDGYVAIPKQHLMEIKSAFEMVMQQQQQQKMQKSPNPKTPQPQ